LLVALQDLKIMSEKDARDILQDAAATHHEASTTSEDADLHRRAAAIIDAMVARGYGSPRP
jgi:hypothetical protein